jgi:predicted regulator of Ras-like GTPase activity (Roadblock/LC7/MglB family)
MTSFSQIIKTQVGKLPEVIAFVLSDASGALLEASGDIDGEAAGAINAVAVRSLRSIGEQLGIGALKRASLLGPGLALVLAANDQEVVGLYIDPGKPLGAFEKKFDSVLQR